MSAMDKLLSDMLKKTIPPEVMQLLTAEKIKEISDNINGYIISTREGLLKLLEASAEIQLAQLKEKETLLDICNRLERIENGRSKDSGGGRKSPSGGSARGNSGGQLE